MNSNLRLKYFTPKKTHSNAIILKFSISFSFIDRIETFFMLFTAKEIIIINWSFFFISAHRTPHTTAKYAFGSFFIYVNGYVRSHTRLLTRSEYNFVFYQLYKTVKKMLTSLMLLFIGLRRWRIGTLYSHLKKKIVKIYDYHGESECAIYQINKFSSNAFWCT